MASMKRWLITGIIIGIWGFIPVDTFASSMPFLDQLNQSRASLKITPLFFDPTLQKAAATQAAYMAAKDKADHAGMNESRVIDRVQTYDYQGDVSEIVYGSADSNQVKALNTLLQSTAHADILLGRFIEAGIANATSSSGRTYWCIVLGVPVGASNMDVLWEVPNDQQIAPTSSKKERSIVSQVGTMIIALFALATAGYLIYLGFQPPKPTYDPLQRR